ncbi:LytR/AlgR family response regulator transcription factor [uncultured Draconibacterium sp.]|uniref:LytR/AlgR family response regulator transcription factor n=1 Tax=uncultured Draconibacterium sp. TaxID=1573823 RepID=UPI0037485779
MSQDKIKVMIVDDEQEAIDLLQILLKENFPEILVSATARSSTEAIEKAFRKHPDLIFLDIKIDHKNGFDILDELNEENHDPHIIFITAYNQYAIDAFKANAIDYLLKPIEPKELINAVNKYLSHSEKELHLKNVLGLINKNKSKIRFNITNGYILIHPEEIVYCQSDGNYSEIYLNDNSKKVVCYNLKNLLKKLPQPTFNRISRYNIINKDYLTEVNRKKQICKLNTNQKEIQLTYSSKMLK